MPHLIIAGQARDAVLRAEQFLVEHQDADGFFREYSLKPGRSEDWTTSLIGHALARAPAATGKVLALAALALHGAWRPGGWGYNRDTVPDADSTAWALRFLARTQGCRTAAATSLLTRYLDSAGRAHTFAEAEAGAWGHAHADVRRYWALP